ncbi:MAG: NAD-dependent protein deacylase [Oscillospiraceae bacterium]
MEWMARFQQMVDQSNHIVFFGGAGVSTESGIPDFRSVDGIYSKKYPYPPEVMLSHSFFERHPEEFFAFHRDKLLFPDAKPNAAHRALAALEAAEKLTAVITQNIDGLHQAAGSRHVLELHGSVWRNYCVCCGKQYSLTWLQNTSGIPRCSCGGIVRPDVVLYEEGLDDAVMSQAIRALSEADMVIVGGTSLVVYPAAGLLRFYSGERLVLINRAPTGMDGRANLIIGESIGEVMGRLQIDGSH